MKSSAKNIVLKSVDDIFQTEENRADAQRERVQEIPLDQLKPFRNHPFKVRDDQRMLDTVDSIREYGVLVPAIARPDPEGGYELISGHRRKRGCEMAGLQTMPVIIRNLDDDAAVLVMVDSNIQREELLPSERAFAYKLSGLYSEAYENTTLFFGEEPVEVRFFGVPGGDEDDFMLNAVTRLEDGRCFLFSADDDFMQSYVSKQRFMAVL